MNTLTHVLELLRVVEIYNMSLKSIVKESNTRRSFRCKYHKKERLIDEISQIETKKTMFSNIFYLP